MNTSTSSTNKKGRKKSITQACNFTDVTGLPKVNCNHCGKEMGDHVDTMRNHLVACEKRPDDFSLYQHDHPSPFHNGYNSLLAVPSHQ